VAYGICQDRCQLVVSSWVRYLILTNGELAVQFYDRRGKRPDVCCLYPGTNCFWYLTGLAWPSKGKFVHAWLYKKRPYKLIKPPCPIPDCPFDLTSNASHSSQTFTTAGADTWTAPAGVVLVMAECWGAGGGGSDSKPGRGGCGGGGGAYAKLRCDVVPGVTYNLQIGTKGAIGAPGNAGLPSWFGDAATVLAAGGKGGDTIDGFGGLGGAVDDSIGCIRYRGGQGAAGANQGEGGGGGSSAGTGTYGCDGGAAGCIAPAGAGVAGNGGAIGSTGTNGGQPGGGGGGAGWHGTSTTGAGGDGKVILTW
jgi:hypothetical protein